MKFDDKINAIEDLKPGLVLEGVITNVTHFGAFIDLGVHQDGLIHISQLSKTYVADPNEVVAVGEVVRSKCWRSTSHENASPSRVSSKRPGEGNGAKLFVGVQPLGARHQE